MSSNIEVAMAWANNKQAKSSKFLRSYRFHTDGKYLYSYGLMIGFTRSSNGNKVLIEYTSAGSFRSRTTSNHVGTARVAADEIIFPKELNEEYNRD